MGSECCSQSKSEPTLKITPIQQLPPSACDASNGGSRGEGFVCTEGSHVDMLLAQLPPDVHAALEDKSFQSRCHRAFQEIVAKREPGNTKDPGLIEGDELIEAVHQSVPEGFLKNRLHASDISKLILAFDTDSDQRINQAEFDLFCMWTVAMDVMGFFTGLTPFAKIVNDVTSDKLLIVSEFLDPDHILGSCALPSTACAYYHPDGMMLEEFSAQIESAAHVRTKQGHFFKSVALANHGPDENGIWNVCSDHPVDLGTFDTAWPRLMPMFKALAGMVSSPSHQGHVDLLACNFAANQAGLDCLDTIEKQVNAKFSASTDATGNVAMQGNWELEKGGRNVAPIYFHEEKLSAFTSLMAPGKAHKPTLPAEDNFYNMSVQDIQYLQEQQSDKKAKGKGKGKTSAPVIRSTFDMQQMALGGIMKQATVPEELIQKSMCGQHAPAKHKKPRTQPAAPAIVNTDAQKAAPKVKAKRSPPVRHGMAGL